MSRASWERSRFFRQSCDQLLPICRYLLLGTRNRLMHRTYIFPALVGTRCFKQEYCCINRIDNSAAFSFDEPQGFFLPCTHELGCRR